MWQDIRYAARSLRKSPGFTAVAVVSLALGIGVNLAIFQFVDAAILKPLPVSRPGELVSLYHQAANNPDTFTATSYPEYEFYRDHNTVLSGMSAYLRVPMNTGVGSDARQISGELVSPDYFSVLGIQLELGRPLTPQDVNAAVISHDFWQQRFAGNSNALGQTVHIGAADFTVVGVAPKSFRGVVLDWADPPSVWITATPRVTAVPALNIDIVHEWAMESYLVFGRLRPGVTTQQASAQMASLTARLREERHRLENQSAVLFPVQQARFWPSYRSGILTFLGALMTIVGAVLLIGCCNLASLLLARATNRRREIAIRLAIGAGRRRIARQLIVEGLLLSAIGSLAAVGVAALASDFLTQFHRPFRIRLAIEPTWDWRVFAFAFAVSVATGIFFGIVPLLQTWRTDVNSDLRTTSATGRAHSGLRKALVVGQVALSTLLLAGSAMFIRTLANARAQDPTLGAANLLLIPLDPSMQGYDDAHGAQFYRDALERAAAVPGVKAAALVDVLPLSGIISATEIVPPGQTRQRVDFNVVSAGYFHTTGLSMLRGREFNDHDTPTAPAVAVVNQAFADRFWPRENPIGKSFDLAKSARTLTVIGIAPDLKFRNYRQSLAPELYLPTAQRYIPHMTLELRTAIPSSMLAAAVRSEIQSLDRSMPITGIQTMQAHLDDSLSQERLLASLATGLGLLALVLAATGIYGVLAFAVSRRSREIGLRMALGARRSEVARMILRESATLTAVGLVLGAAGAYMLARLAQNLLYGVAAGDPITFAATSAILATVAALAGAAPAYRAASIDPAATLRSE
jgi:predicted permease